MLSRGSVEKAPRRLRDQHRAAVAGEEQNSVLQIAENLIEILLQRGEDLFHVAHALADRSILVETWAAVSCLGSAFGSLRQLRRPRSSSRAGG